MSENEQSVWSGAGGWRRAPRAHLNIQMREAQLAELRQVAESRDVSLGHLVREAVDRFLAEAAEGAGG